VILTMAKLRIMGPRDRLSQVLSVVQDLGLVHLAPAPASGHLTPIQFTPEQQRLRRAIRRALDDIETVQAQLGSLGPVPASRTPRGEPATEDMVRWCRLARRIRREADRLAVRAARAEEERALIVKYRALFSAFEDLLRPGIRWEFCRSYHVILQAGQAGVVTQLRDHLSHLVGADFEVRAHDLPGGETALLILVPAEAAERVERLFAESRVQEIPVPSGYGGRTLADAVPGMLRRLEAIPGELGAIADERRRLVGAAGKDLLDAQAAFHDLAGRLDALPLSTVTRGAFVFEGWVPERVAPKVGQRLLREVGDTIVVEQVEAATWADEGAPVVLRNPRLFRPFEMLIRLLPLPRYGSIDPTPYVAVFFPMFFGLMVGDVGYGLMLAGLSLILRRRSSPDTPRRAVSEIAGACAAFTVLFGFAFGEFFGDLGRRWFGLRPLVFNREESVVPFLALVIALGLVHVLLGLGLGVASAFRGHRRQALGRGISAVMIGLIVVSLLAVTEVLPRELFTPAVTALVIAFPLLIIAEGIVAPVELLSTLGNILSYARIMALGTASVMLAVVANQMVGALGSVAVGVIFALLFHLVNFALALFSPTIHALRLHYVEFFGRFYSPGGVRYQPLEHWRPTAGHPAHKGATS
jgi:V/A-type H+-transporting ATPase subunit I